MIQKQFTARSTITLWVLLFQVLTLVAGTVSPPPCNITGNSVSCVNQLEYYYVAQTTGSTYVWAISGGGSLSNNTGPSAMVNWTAAGTYQVIVTETATGGGVFTCTQSVQVYPRPVPKIFTDYISDCQDPPKEEEEPGQIIGPRKDPECWIVCENMNVNYWASPQAGYSYQWTFTGATPSIVNGPNANVTWGVPGLGAIILSVTSPGGCVESITQCVEVIAAPVPNFTYNDQPYYEPLKICKGETVYFNDFSEGATKWLWDFGDGSTSTLQNPAHNYPGPGVYYGTLTVKNNCGCSAVLNFEVYVEDRISPVIGCISTLCLKECAFYTVTNLSNCPNAEVRWFPRGGQIVNTPVNGSVNIVWDDHDGFIAQNGYGLICVRVSNCENLCDGEVCVRVPIIHKARIFGPTEVCAGEQVTYYVQNQPGINEPGQWPPNGVNFDWQFSGLYQVISQSPYSNSITVVWFGSGGGTVTLKGYENYVSPLGCSYEPDPLNINIKQKFILVPEVSKACVGEVKTINATGFGTFSWTVAGPNGVSGPITGGSSFNVTISQAGTYIVTAQEVSSNYCPTQPKAVITASPQPAAPTGSITGSNSICPNTPYTYSISAPPPAGHYYTWSAQNGTLSGTGGQTVSVQWNGTPPMVLSVRSKSNLEPFCESAPLSFSVSTYVPPANFVNGPATSCVNQTATFDATALSNYTNLQWSVVPATAGSVTAGQGSNLITVLFNANAPSSAQIVATATVCGNTVSSSRTVSINAIPTLSIVGPNSVCEGAAVPLSVTPNTGIASYNWDFGDGNTSSQAAPNYVWNSTGSFPVSVTATLNTCGNPTLTASKTIQVNPSPVPVITAPNGNVICPALGINSVSLTVNTQVSCTYSWSNMTTGPTTTVFAPGIYSVTATNVVSGCINIDSIYVFGCGGSGGGGCIPQTSPWTFVAIENCDTYTFIPTTTPANFIGWSFGDGTLSFTPGPVTHTYAHAGFYNVLLVTFDPIQQCTLFHSETISVKFKGAFTANFDCSSGSMKTTLTDRSEYLPQFPPASKSWYDGGTFLGSGDVLGNLSLSPGMHSISIVVSVGGQTCTHTQSVTVPGMPQAAFVHNGPKCEGVPVQFTNTSTGGGLNNVVWNFGDGATSNVQNPQRVYDAPPNTFVATLTVSNNWGCSSSASSNVAITSQGAAPTISLSPNTPVCAGTNVTLIASASLPPTVNYTWYNAANPGIALQGPSPQNTYVTNTNGLYGIRATDGNGCPYNTLAPSPVVVTPLPYVNISGNTDVCVGGLFKLSADIGANYTYLWTFTTPSGTSSQNGPSLLVSASVAGNYSFTVQITAIGSNCTSTGTAMGVAHDGVPDLNITASNTCLPALLSATGTGITSYNWSEGSNTSQIAVTQAGEYSVVVSDAWGCTTKAEISVDGPPDMSNVMTGCYEFCDAVMWQAPNCNNCTYQWTFNGVDIPGATDPYLKIGQSGVYTVKVTTANGCSAQSAPIDISVVDAGACNDCKAEVKEMKMVCRGKSPITGQTLYEFWLDVINYAGAWHGTTVTSNLGQVDIIYPAGGFLPGGGAVTKIHGYLHWYGTADNGCFDVQGFLTKDCSEASACQVQWCGLLPACCKGECALKVSDVKAVCLAKGYYQVSGTVSNFGCDLFDVFVKTQVGNFPLWPSTIYSGTSVTYSRVVAIPAGTYGFQVCGYDASGDLCCRESSIKVPKCDGKVNCAFEVMANKMDCDGYLPDGTPKYSFEFTAFGIPPGYTVHIAPQQIGYVMDVNVLCSGSACSITGTYVNFGDDDPFCFGFVAISPDPEPKICLGEACIRRPKCGRPGKIEARNFAQNTDFQTLDFELLPNPASQSVRVMQSDKAEGAFEISVVDMYGKRVRNIRKESNQAVEIDLIDLPAGVYIVTLQRADGTQQSRKLFVE